LVRAAAAATEINRHYPIPLSSADLRLPNLVREAGYDGGDIAATFGPDRLVAGSALNRDAPSRQEEYPAAGDICVFNDP
jgi:hypothetical protein